MADDAVASSFFSDGGSSEPAMSCSLPSEVSHRGGFRGMFKVPSLVFDIELEDNGIGAQWQEDDWEEDEVVNEIHRFVQPTTHSQARLLSDVKAACPHAKDGQDTARLAAILSALGYKCSSRTALGGGDGADCLRNLRHTFITCETPAAAGAPARRYIVDAQFREQFIIAKATARYASILEAIPQVFVGPEEHLSLLVNFLCTEMNTAFRQLGSVLPPWRQASSMLSKWKPRKACQDEGLAPQPVAVAGPHAGVAPAAAAVADAMADQGGRGAPEWPGAGAAQQAPCRPTAAAVPLQPCNPTLHHWQQAAAGQLIMAGTTTAGVSVRRGFEPQRVVLGGNFIPISAASTPAPAS